MCFSCVRVCSLLPCGQLLGKGWTVVVIVFLLLSHVVSCVRCGTWLYRFLIFAVFLTFYADQKKKRHIRCPQTCSSKTTPWNNNMHFHCLADTMQPFTQRDFLEKYQTVTENVSNSETRAMRTRKINFKFFNIYEYSSIKNGMYCMSFNSQFNEIKGQAFYCFEIISLAIKRISYLYLLIICIFRWFFFSNPRLGYHLSNFRRCFFANRFNQSNPFPTVYHFTFSMGSSMHSEKACLKWTKVRCSKPRLSEAFAFEAIILTSLWQTVSNKFSENDWRVLLGHASKFMQMKGIWKLYF